MLSVRKKKVIGTLCIGMGLFILFFVLLFLYGGNPAFLDEQDNLLGGEIVAGGQHIYKDFISQHMPGMYYLCMLFSKMGIQTVTGYRAAFYVTLVCLFLFMFFRYSKSFGKIAMIIYPIFYCCMLVELPYSTTVLAEHVQAQMLVVLFLEFLLYMKTNTLKWVNILIISICIFSSIMMAFVAVWAVAVIVAGVFFFDIYHCFVKKDVEQKEKAGQYLKLICIVAAPFVLLLIYLVITGNLKNMYYQAFQFNREIYPKYIQTKYGGSIIYTMAYPFFNYAKVFIVYVQSFGENIMHNLRVLMNFFVNITFAWYLFRKNKWASLIAMAFVIMCGSRAFDDFHSIPYWAVTAMMLGLLIQKKKAWDKLLPVFVIIVVFIFPYMSNVLNLANVRSASVVREGEVAYYVDMLTDEDETIYVTNLAADEYIKSNRMPASRLIHIHPWFMEKFQQDVIGDLEVSKPKIVFHDENTEIWSNRMSDFAPELCEYIKENYRQVPEIESVNLWIRKDAYEETIGKYLESKE